MHGYYTMRSREFPEGQRKKENKKIEIQTLWENSDPLGAIVQTGIGITERVIGPTGSKIQHQQ